MASKLLLSCVVLFRPILAKPIHQNLEQRQWPGFPGFQGPPGQVDSSMTFPFTGPPTGIPTPWGPWGPQASQACNTVVWPNEGDLCSDIAAQHNLPCSSWVGAMAIDSTHCQELLSRNCICVSWSFAISTYAATTTSFSSSSPSPAALSSSFSNTTATTLTTNTTLTSTLRVGTSSSVISTVVNTTQTLTGSSTSVTPSSSAAADSTSSTSSSSSSTISTSNSTRSTSSSTSSSSTTSLPATTSITSLSITYVPAFPTSTTSTMQSEVAPTSATQSQSQCNAAQPPAETQPGIVAGCTRWYVAQTGDYCYSVAQEIGISVDTFMQWNPAVEPPTFQRMLAGFAYCVATCSPASSSTSASRNNSPIYSSFQSTVTTTSSALTTILNSSSLTAITTTSSTPAAATSAAPSSTISPSDKYVSYCGDGSTAAGWPSESQWLSFDSLFTYNTPNMKISCQQWGVPNDSDSEIAEMKSSILSVSTETGIDARFILAIIMQESTGCVRVITTAYSHANPGLMQTFNGTGSCNTNNAPSNIPGGGSASGVQTPCPASEINQMILDGTNGTVWGPGLKQDMVTAEVNAADPAQAYYRTARIYNGGTFVADDLSLPCCTSSYASDVANRLMGWVHAPRTYTCGS